jgi:type I restriction enzyme S subunit
MFESRETRSGINPASVQHHPIWRTSQIKYIDLPDKEFANLRLEPGDILFVERNGSKAELGRCALWHGEIADCVHQNHILNVRPNAARLLSDFAMPWFDTDAGKDHFFRSAKTSSGLGTVNSSERRAGPVPVPTLSVQKQIVDRVTKSRAEIAKLKADAKARADVAKADVEAMILGATLVE